MTKKHPTLKERPKRIEEERVLSFRVKVDFHICLDKTDTIDLVKTHSAFQDTIRLLQNTAGKIMVELRRRNWTIVSSQTKQLSQKMNELEKEHERQDKSKNWRDAYV